MKKILLGSFACVSLSIMLAFNINQNNQSGNISLELSNIEALASDENGEVNVIYCCGNSETCYVAESVHNGKIVKVIVHGRKQYVAC